MLKHVVPSQQKYFVENNLKQAESRIASRESMTEKLRSEKHPLFHENIKDNIRILAPYNEEKIFQAGGVTIVHLECQKQDQTRVIINLNKTKIYIPISPAKLPEIIEEKKSTFITFGK